MSGEIFAQIDDYSLLAALKQRRSRRFALGMKMPSGPLAYQSRHPPLALTEEEEACLTFAASGITGFALLDLPFSKEQGGAIVARSLGRTFASGDAIQTVALLVANDDATYLIRRPQDLLPAEIQPLIDLAHQNDFTEIYRRMRVKIKDSRAAPPVAPMFNVNVNRWSLYAPGTTYFLPINELTFMYINGLLEIFNEHTGAFVVDERAGLRAAGLKRFGRSSGGHLSDNPADGRMVTVQRLELMVSELVTVEQGMMLQNLGLMSQAMGIGGFPNFAEHESSWFEALGFLMGTMTTARYLGANFMITGLMNLHGRNKDVHYPLALERDGQILLRPFCPPFYRTMKEAVQAIVDIKYGSQGTFRGGITQSAWRDPAAIANGIPEISEHAVDATIAYCQYIYDRYHRFPAYSPPFRTVLGFQACHLDTEFYDRYYRAEALSEIERSHMENWHDTPARKNSKPI
ncbi:MAG TPA: hypothetical protein VGH22_01545 [Candidatus Binatia bacterium]